MKPILTSICLTIAALLGSAGVSWSADYQKGLTAAENGDYVTALREWTALAEQGDVRAQYNLGQMYRMGHGVSRDYKIAVKWYTLAAEKGLSFAQFNLGTMYFAGNGVMQDYEIAAKWQRLAAEQGLAIAQNILGLMYFKGNGVPKDYSAALKWDRLAAEQRHGDAQHNLGLMYAMGEGGVPLNDVRAYMWVALGTINGSESGKEVLAMLQEQMTQSQIEEAQKLAHECVFKEYKGC